MSTRRLSNLVGALALGVTDRMSAALDAALDAEGSLVAALMSVATRPGSTIHDLAAVIGRSHSATVRIVDRLAARGWVRRATDERDSRAVALFLTAPGQAACRRALRARQTAVQQALQPLSARERVLFQRLVAKMLGGLPRDRADARHICRLCDHAPCHRATCPVGASVPDAL